MANENADGQKTEESTSTQNGGEVVLSQEKLNSLINEKFAKGATQAQKQLLEELGLESVDDLKSIVKQKKELDEKNKTELEKLQARLEEEAKEKARLEKEANEIKKKMTIKELAFKNNVRDVEFLEFEYAKASQSDNFNEEDFIKSLKEKKPYIFKDRNVPTDGTPNTPNSTNQIDKLKKLSFEELRKLANEA